MKHKLVLGAMVGVLAITASAPAFARGETESESNDDKSLTSRLESTVQKTVSGVDDGVNRTAKLTETEKTETEHAETKKGTLRDELKQLRTENKQKLEGRRLAKCQNRQKNINELMDTSAANGKQRLANIQQFEARVREFYEKKNLTSDQYTAVSQTVDAKEEAAIAALNTIASEDYDCSNIDAAKPAETIKVMRTTKHAALKEYRASVVELIHVVKAAFAATQTEKTEGGAQ